MTEYDKMQAGQMFNQTDFSVLLQMAKCYRLVRKLNKTSLFNQPRRNRLIKKLFGSIDGTLYYVQSPLFVDYGCNIHVGKNFLSNYNVVLQDESEIFIGDDVMLAANVVITTDLHPMIAEQRKVCYVKNWFPSNHRGNYVYGKPIHIGNGVWICANSTICGGVTIGDNSVIGAGSVVTRDIPPNVFACGVPCKVIRPITEADRKKLTNEGELTLQTNQ